MPKRLLVAVDGSEESVAAAQYAVELAVRMKAELSALHVMLLPEYVSDEVRNRLERELSSRGQSALKRVRLAAKGKNVVLSEKMLTTTKSVITTICDFAASDGAGLIIMGTKGAGGVANMMLGNVATGVVREARCPVLVVR
ncbi:MAG TPA: universal stress protein [Candidatus Angelobacter sp.]|nr:universal stress protein [Candidatus Angelobacter sp.]